MTAAQPAPAEANASRFLRLCLGAHLEPAGMDRLRTWVAENEVDWQAIGRLAHEQRLGPLIYYTLRDTQVAPPALTDFLRESYQASSLRNLLFLHEVGVTVRALAAAGIGVIVLKGAALAEAVYRNIALRPMEDIDVLVHDTDLSAAVAVLARCGYAPQRVEPRPGAGAAYENELLLLKSGVGLVPLDIHWSLFDSPFYQGHIPMDWFWETARQARIGDATALMLGPAAQVIHLCGHLALHHGGEQLLWLHDLAELIACNGSIIDWEKVITCAQEFDLVLSVQRVLTQVVDGWPVHIPAQVVAQLRALQPSADEVRIVGRLTASDRPVAQRFWSDVTSLSGWSQRLRFAWANLFPSAAYMRERYRIRHPLLLPFYYPYRWYLGLRSAL